jgi:predicted DCC family thiol-disulfide oxidoreductase YuxK
VHSESAVILFDGVCNLCNASVNFILDRDLKRHFKFGALQSDEGMALLKKYNLSGDYLDSIVLLEGGVVYTNSTAALRVARRLSGAWPLMYGFIIIPEIIRNPVYNWIARNRYKWFGKQDVCRMPTPETRARFI